MNASNIAPLALAASWGDVPPGMCPLPSEAATVADVPIVASVIAGPSDKSNGIGPLSLSTIESMAGGGKSFVYAT